MTVTSTEYQADYLRALRNGDERRAQAVVKHAQHHGLQPNAIYYEIFGPAMMQIGDLWQRNELSVAEEHLATAITEGLIAWLSVTYTPGVGEGLDTFGRIALGCPPGEQHALGLRMLADLFRREDWQTLYLGADVPMLDWVALVTRFQTDAVALSVSVHHIEAARQTIKALHEAVPGLLILVGGAAFDQSPTLWRELGADLYNLNPLNAVKQLTSRQRQKRATH